MCDARSLQPDDRAFLADRTARKVAEATECPFQQRGSVASRGPPEAVAISVPSSTVDRDGVRTVEGYGLAGDGPFDGLSVSDDDL
jgi:hypothetical protein